MSDSSKPDDILNRPVKRIVLPKRTLPPVQSDPEKVEKVLKAESLIVTQTSSIKLPDIRLPNNGLGLSMFYNYMFMQQGFNLPNHLMHLCWAIADNRIPKLLVVVGPGSGKATSLDTPVLTPSGWRPAGSLSINDKIIRPDGKQTASIIAINKQPPNRLYKVTFADGRSVKVSKEHLWKINHKKLSRENRGSLGPDGLLWDVASTEEIYDRLTSYKALRWYVPLIEPIKYPKADLPIPPYTLGVILGDGCISDFGGVAITNPDREIRNEVEKEIKPYNFSINDRASNSSNCPCWSILGIFDKIRSLGLVHHRSWEKFIPEIYKTASIEQRLSLIQGLMDTDGSCFHSASYCTTSIQLANDVRDIIWSLGGIVKISTRQTYFTHKGIKKPRRISYRLNIRFRDPTKLFHLPKKKNNSKGDKNQYSETLKLRIISIEQDSIIQPSVCFTLDSNDGLYIVGDYIVTHNSTVVSICYPAFAIGQDPNITTIGMSAGEKLIQGFCTAVGDWIEHHPMWKALFPKVSPDKDKGWSTERGLFVTGHPPGNPDANYFAAGLTSKAVTGKHARLIIGDDLHDRENSNSLDACLTVREFYYRQIIGRADPRGARFIFAGRRWHQEDLYGHLKNTGEWVVMELPAFRDGSNELYWDITVPDNLECCFTEQRLSGVPNTIATMANAMGVDIENYKLPTPG